MVASSPIEAMGGSLDRPALQKLLDTIRARRVDVVVVYKVDRLTRSLADFAKLIELFDVQGGSFVSRAGKGWRFPLRVRWLQT